MKLKDNVDYLYLKARMQSKYDDNDYLPNPLKDSIKAILKRCEDQEKEIEELNKDKFKVEDKVNVKLSGGNEPGTIIRVDKDYEPKIGIYLIKFDDSRYATAHYREDELEIIQEYIIKDKIRHKIVELELQNKIPLKNQNIMYDVMKRNFQIEILKELLEENK